MLKWMALATLICTFCTFLLLISICIPLVVKQLDQSAVAFTYSYSKFYFPFMISLTLFGYNITHFFF